MNVVDLVAVHFISDHSGESRILSSCFRRPIHSLGPIPVRWQHMNDAFEKVSGLSCAQAALHARNCNYRFLEHTELINHCRRRKT